MNVKVFNNAENALNLDAANKETVNPAIGNNWHGRKIAAVTILSIGCAVAAVAAVANAIFFSQLVAIVCIAAAITLLVSTILAGRIKISDDMLKLVDNLSNKAHDLYKKVHANVEEKFKQDAEIKRLNDEMLKIQKQHKEEIANLQKQLDDKKVEAKEPALDAPAQEDVQQDLPEQKKVDAQPEQNEVQPEQNPVKEQQVVQEKDKPEVQPEQNNVPVQPEAPKEQAPVQNEQVVKAPVKEGYDDVEGQPAPEATQTVVEGEKTPAKADGEKAPENAGQIQDPLTQAAQAEIPLPPPLPEEKKPTASLTNSKVDGTTTPKATPPTTPVKQGSGLADKIKGLFGTKK